MMSELSEELKDILNDCSMHYMCKNSLRDIAENIEALEKQIENPEIVLPKITPEMVEYLEPELIAFDEDGIAYWKQVAADFAGFLKIKESEE